MDNPTQKPHGARALVVFETDSQAYALPAANVVEVLPMTGFSEPPDRPIGMDGLLDFEGELIPVLAASTCFGRVPRPATAEAHLLLVRADRTRFALRVDRVHEVLPRAVVSPFDDESAWGAWAEGQFDWKGAPCFVLRASRLASHPALTYAVAEQRSST